MTITTTIGLVAACCTTLSFLPQVIQVWRTRSTQDISLGMYSVFVTGVSLWILYGLRTGDWVIVLANAVTLLLAGAILTMKLCFERAASKGSVHHNDRTL